jgi:hypothetical protein
MNDLAQYSDAFILAQMNYYKQNTRCGPSRDWNIINGLYRQYWAEANRRGLL